MPPRFLKKIGRAGKKFGSFVDKVSDDLGDKLSDIADDGPVRRLIRCSTDVAVISRETIEICDDTTEKREAMIAFGKEISETLENFSDAGTLETIKELTSGDKVEAAMDIAKGLGEVAKACVEKSVQMTDLMDEAIEGLPDFVKDSLEKFADEDDSDDEEEDEVVAQRGIQARGFDQDIDDVALCVDSIQNLNLSTALQVGTRAFSQLSHSSEQTRTMFDTIRSFSSDVREISDATEEFNVGVIIRKSKDMLRCIFLSEEMRSLAVTAGKLINVVIDLFAAIADRISDLWGALAFAKDCIADCLQFVTDARGLCTTAKERGVDLIRISGNVMNKLDEVGDFDKESIGAIRGLVQDGEIEEAIGIATNMDDLVLECSEKVVVMVDRVQEGFSNLPDILTEGVAVDEAGCGLGDDEPEPADVEDDIAAVEESIREIEESNIITAGKAGMRGFRAVSEKTGKCKGMLELVVQFTGNCDSVIDTFMNVWNLESAGSKILEICNLANLGKMMKQWAEQIKRLLMGIINLLRAAFQKFTQRLKDAFEDVGDLVDAAKDRIEDRVDALKDKMQDRLRFWKK